MHIAILLTGHTNKAMPQCFHDYHHMFTTLFQGLPNGRNFRFTKVAVVDDVFPKHLDDYDGYLISGSAYGVYDDVPFIARLIDLIQQIHQAKKPLFGVCFGHQIIAHALGGQAQKWDDGWVLGTMEVTLTKLPDWVEEKDWIDSKHNKINLIHVHQDQVIKLPRGQSLLPLPTDVKTRPLQLAIRYLPSKDIQNLTLPTPMHCLVYWRTVLAKAASKRPVNHYQNRMMA